MNTCPPDIFGLRDGSFDRYASGASAKRRTAREIEATWLHHRFTQIHPFQDGNGRVARALASLVFFAGLVSISG